MSKHFYIKTYGCQMNFYDSERIADLLTPMGYKKTDKPEESDLVILNTCHIREKAAEKVYSEIGLSELYLVICDKLVDQAPNLQFLPDALSLALQLGPHIHTFLALSHP